MGRFSYILGFFLICIFTATGLSQNTDKKQLAEQIRIEVENLSIFTNKLSGGSTVHASKVLPKFYLQRNYQPAWVKSENIEQFLTYLGRAEAEGLLPNDYHYSMIREKLIQPIEKIPPAVRAGLDILLTDAFLTYTSHMLNGKVDPVSVHPEWNVVRREEDPLVLLNDYLQSGDIASWWDKILPENQNYNSLKNALEKYRIIHANGGWPAIPPGDVLEKGMTDKRIGILRQRLILSGDLPELQYENELFFDSEMEKAVMQFQRRHGLEADGRVGKASLAELNTDAGERVKQLMVNIERWRWLPLDLGNYYLVVNIANYELDIIQDNKEKFTSQVIVGKPFRKTPVFSASMSYIVFNPTWTVPPTILTQDILPQVKKDPTYLAQRNMKLLDQQGREIDPMKVDWAVITGKGFPYIIRQEPGPNNALGDVKFMFPNPYHVYIHDTPNRELFAKSDRSFSSGCIRVSEPLKLAEFLLNDPQNWNREKINKLIDSRKTSSIFLKQKIAVYLLYWTSWVDGNGHVHFRKDIYERDAKVFEALTKTQ